MKFSFDLYKKATLIWPLISCIIGLILIISAIIFMIISKSGYKTKIIQSSTYILVAIYLIIFNAPVLKYGIHLFNENPESSLVITGTIDEIQSYSKSPKYTLEDRIAFASIVTIDDETYYFMYAEEIDVGEYIEIVYLPNSHIVLEYNIIN